MKKDPRALSPAGLFTTELACGGYFTPPIGMNAFVVKSVLPDVKLADIFRGITPFVFALAVGLVLVLAIPQIATLLPSTVR